MTIKELAQLAGVSASTVSKVVNGKDQNINEATRARILSLVKEYHYRPYGALSSQSHARTFLLGILVTDAEKWSQTLAGILKEASARGYGTVVYESGCSGELELRCLTALCTLQADGVLWEPAGEESRAYEAELQKAGIPFWKMGSGQEISMDLRKLGYDCTRELIREGHRKIGFAMRDASSALQILEGYKQCLFDYGIPFHDNFLITETFSHIVDNSEFTGILCPNEEKALEICGIMDRLKPSVPEFFSLVTLYQKDDRSSGQVYPFISGLSVPWKAFGQNACRYVLQTLEETSEKNTAQQKESYEIFSPSIPFYQGRTLKPCPGAAGPKAVVVGSIHMDYRFLVSSLPAAGRTTPISRSQIRPGGKGLNQAVGAARLGCQVSLISALGDDGDKGPVLEFLDQEGVELKGIFTKKGPTGKAYIYTQEDGESSISLLPGANSRLAAEDIRECRELFQKADLCLLSSEIPLPALTEAARLAKSHGLITILKPAALSRLPEELGGLIDFFVPNETEAALLCPGCSLEEQARTFSALGFSTVIITLGRQGCYVRSSRWTGHIPASALKASDTTGGADALISALAASLSRFRSLRDALEAAQYAAGLCISRAGGAGSMAKKEEMSPVWTDKKAGDPSDLPPYAPQ